MRRPSLEIVAFEALALRNGSQLHVRFSQPTSEPTDGAVFAFDQDVAELRDKIEGFFWLDSFTAVFRVGHLSHTTSQALIGKLTVC